LIWHKSDRSDPFARDIADRHYNRQHIGATGFVPPGRCLVLKARTDTGRAFWVTSWPFAQYVKHAWGGAWICSAFRNEGAGVASVLIREAVSATRAYWPDTPSLGMITFLDRSKVQPTMIRGRKTWGRTWELVGFRHIGETQGGLMVLQLSPEDMPAPCYPNVGSQPKDWPLTRRP
jgi:hypothetical protein